jgi:hypothetical protein
MPRVSEGLKITFQTYSVGLTTHQLVGEVHQGFRNPWPESSKLRFLILIIMLRYPSCTLACNLDTMDDGTTAIHQARFDLVFRCTMTTD